MVADATLLALFLTGLLGGAHCAGMCGGIVGALGLLDARLSGARPAAGGGAENGVSGERLVAPLRFVPQPAWRAATATPEVMTGIPVPPPARRATATQGERLGVDAGGSARSRRLARLLGYNAGRLASYTVLGAAAGTVGSFGWLLGEALPVQQIAYAASSVLLITMGLYIAGQGWIVRHLEGLGGGLWRRVRPAATRALAHAGSPGGALAAGALWGLVPCGMVYAALAGALVSGGGGRGAVLMLAFGLGTLPNLLLLGSGASWLGRLSRRRPVRLAAAGTIIVFGLFGLLRLDVAAEVPVLRELCVHIDRFGA